MVSGKGKVIVKTSTPFLAPPKPDRDELEKLLGDDGHSITPVPGEVSVFEPGLTVERDDGLENI